MAWTAQHVAADKPEHFFLERYRVAYANEMAHFFETLANGKAPRTTIGDGVAALALAEAATTSWREQRIVEF
jgi:myo-inositol 2-dehydrogenase/D-chiro-inositol 1-dehydrogenase